MFNFTFVVQINEKSIIYSVGKYKEDFKGAYVFLSLPPQETDKMGM